MKREYEKGYKMPLKAEKHGSFIWDKNHNMSAMFLDDAMRDSKKFMLVEHINDEVLIKGIESPFSIKNGIITDATGKEIIMVRGWGHLTGTGGLNLPNIEAELIQDDFGNFLVERLNAGIGELK